MLLMPSLLSYDIKVYFGLLPLAESKTVPSIWVVCVWQLDSERLNVLYTSKGK